MSSLPTVLKTRERYKATMAFPFIFVLKQLGKDPFMHCIIRNISYLYLILILTSLQFEFYCKYLVFSRRKSDTVSGRHAEERDGDLPCVSNSQLL